MMRRLLTLLFSLLITCELFGQVILEAEPSYIRGDGSGVQQWDDGVEIKTYNLNGSGARLVYDTQFRDKGFGVAGARWNQIDFYKIVDGTEKNQSEQFEVLFNGPVTNVVLTVGMMGLNEGGGGNDETGKWTGYDQGGNEVASGLLGPDRSLLGPDVKYDGTYGKYPIALPSSVPLHRVIIEATGFGYGQGEPKQASYGENNSDFNIAGISYERGSTTTNRPPQAVDDDQFEIREDIGLTAISYATLLRNDSDPDGDPIRIVGFDFTGFPGTIENRVDREDILFTTAVNFNGQIQFPYTITDGNASDVGIITLTITETPDDLTIGQDGPFTTDKNTPVTIAKSDLLSNDSSIPYLSSPVELVIDAVGDAINGTVTLQDENVVFTPSTNFVGGASFTYTVLVLNDGFGDPRPVNEGVSPPIVVDVLGDDTPQISINQKAVIVSKLDPNFILQVNNASNRSSAVVEACDEQGQIWTISDRGNGFHKIINDFANKALEAWQRSPANGDDVTIYDSNNKDWQQWEILDAGNGFFKIKGKYNPRFLTFSNGNAIVTDESTADNQLWKILSPEAVSCTTDNRPPVAVDDEPFGFIPSGRTGFTFGANLLLDNDSDPDGDDLSIIAVGDFENVSVEITSSTVLTLATAADYSGPAQFSYTISDGSGNTATAIVSLTITNESPIARNDGGFNVTENRPFYITFDEVLANDEDPDGDELTVFEVTDAQNGEVELLSDQIAFFPNQPGTATFAYTITDGTGQFATALVILNVEFSTTLNPVSLSASSFESNGTTNAQPWSDCVTIQAFDAQGAATTFGKRKGRIGPASNRYNYQIDYDATTGTTETVRINFNQSVEEVSITFGNMEVSEYQGLDETGYWITFDTNGSPLESGILSPTTGSKLGRGVYRFTISSDALHSIEIGATAYSNGEGTEAVSNNSDFSIVALDFTPQQSSCSPTNARIENQALNLVPDSPASLPELRATLFPNPAKESVTLTLGSATDREREVLVYDVRGALKIQKVLPASVDFLKIPTEQLESGLYFVHIQGFKNAQRLIKK